MEQKLISLFISMFIRTAEEAFSSYMGLAKKTIWFVKVSYIVLL